MTVSLMAAKQSLFPMASYFDMAYSQVVPTDITFQCLVGRNERWPIYIDGTGHMPTHPVKAWPHGEWWTPAGSTGTSTSSGVAYCWSFRLMTTWYRAHQVPLERSAEWTYARKQ